MTSNVKLSNFVRDRIIKTAMEGAFEKEFAVISKKIVAHAMDCYRSHVSVEDEKAARKAPADFLLITNNMKIDYYDPDTGRHLDSEYNVEVPKAVPFRSRQSAGYLNIKDRNLYLAHKALSDERAALIDKRDELRNSIRQTVYSTGSLKKLIEMWPEVETFLPADLTPPKPQLPALPVADLNAALKAAGIKVGVIKSAPVSGGLVAVAA
jgi:hypothetical protein